MFKVLGIIMVAFSFFVTSVFLLGSKVITTSAQLSIIQLIYSTVSLSMNGFHQIDLLPSLASFLLKVFRVQRSFSHYEVLPLVQKIMQKFY